MKHKWHKEIKAWADGAEIQFLDGVVWLNAGDPEWNYDCTYRIKPQPKEPQYLYVIMFDGNIDKVRLSQYARLGENEFILGKVKLEVDYADQA